MVFLTWNKYRKHEIKFYHQTGCKLYKIDAITKHVESKIHLRSREIEAQLQKPVKKSDAAKVLSSLNRSNTEKLSKMFRTCDALVL